MFTGRVRQVGIVTDVAPGHITIAANKIAACSQPGSSIAVNGVCLTLAAIAEDSFEAGLSAETQRRTALASLQRGDTVNLEPALVVGDSLDGHLVQGHVDGTGKVARLEDDGIGQRVWIRTSDHVVAQLVPKGSVAVDGVSLTVADIGRDRFSVALVPMTLAETTLAGLQVDQRVNIETDLVAKIAHRPSPAAALAAVVGALPWAGPLSGRLGIEKAISQMAAGGGVVIFDPNRENEADVVFAGARFKPEGMAFLLTQACGHTTVPCDLARLDRLEIPRLAGEGDRHGTSPHLPVDLKLGTGTGVSAVERSATIRRLAHPDATASDFIRPGHVFPLGAVNDGLLARRGHTEASLAMCVAAGLPTVAAICEVMGRDGLMAGSAELERLSLGWGMPMVSIDDLVEWL